MTSIFLFDGVETASINGVRNSIRRRVPERGFIECEVKPLTVDSRIMKRRLPCRVRIHAGYNGGTPYVFVLGNSATARDLYRVIRYNTEYCVDLYE